MRALLKPLKPKQLEELVELLSRTGHGRIKVKLSSGTTFAVDPFRLFAEADRQQRISKAELEALPWAGKGSDPLEQPTATLAPPWGAQP